MPEVKVKAGEELNGLGKMLKETIDTNLQDSQEAGFENMAYISSGQISPTMALLTRKVKARGNLLVLMKIAPLMVLKG